MMLNLRGTLLLLRQLGCQVGILSMTSGTAVQQHCPARRSPGSDCSEAKEAAAFLAGGTVALVFRDIEVVFNAENLHRVRADA
jgi:hypothetical protein